MGSCEKVRVKGRKCKKWTSLITDGGMGRKWFTGYLWEERFGGQWQSCGIERELYGRIVIPTVVYDSETWSLSVQERRKIEVFEMMCLRNIYGIRRVDRVRNAIIREMRM